MTSNHLAVLAVVAAAREVVLDGVVCQLNQGIATGAEAPRHFARARVCEA
jgi:hypothetical protein